MSKIYNLRTRKTSPIYVDSPSHTVLNGITCMYNTYEECGLVSSYHEKSYMRYGNDPFKKSIKDFLYVHKKRFNPEIFSQFLVELDLDNIYDLPLDKLLKYQYIEIKRDLFGAIMPIIKDTYASLDNTKLATKNTLECLEDHLETRQTLIFLTDFCLLMYKFEYNTKYSDIEKYNNILNMNDKQKTRMDNKYKKFKQSQYDRQKVPLLYNTSLPKDVCEYVIKEFL
jgi:hypothetical protein